MALLFAWKSERGPLRTVSIQMATLSVKKWALKTIGLLFRRTKKTGFKKKSVEILVTSKNLSPLSTFINLMIKASLNQWWLISLNYWPWRGVIINATSRFIIEFCDSSSRFSSLNSSGWNQKNLMMKTQWKGKFFLSLLFCITCFEPSSKNERGDGTPSLIWWSERH